MFQGKNIILWRNKYYTQSTTENGNYLVDLVLLIFTSNFVSYILPKYQNLNILCIFRYRGVDPQNWELQTV